MKTANIPAQKSGINEKYAPNCGLLFRATTKIECLSVAVIERDG